MNLTPEQIAAVQKANLETLAGLTNQAIQSVEKLVELNMQITKNSLSESMSNAKKSLEVRDLQQLIAQQAVTNPYSLAKGAPSTRLSKMFGTLGATTAAARGGELEMQMQGGGHELDAMIETTKRAFEVPTVSKDHLYFGLLLLMLPLCGFAAYALTKKKNEYKKDEVSRDSRTI